MSPDTIVPTSTQGTQAWDRYTFVNNNPVRYTDPTGHNAGVFCAIWPAGTITCIAVVIILVVGLYAYGSEWDPEEPGSAPDYVTPQNPADWFKDPPPASTSPPPPPPCLDPAGCLMPGPTNTPTVSPTPTLPDSCPDAEFCWNAPPTVTPTPTPTPTSTPTPTLLPLPTFDLNCAINPYACEPPPTPSDRER